MISFKCNQQDLLNGDSVADVNDMVAVTFLWPTCKMTTSYKFIAENCINTTKYPTYYVPFKININWTHQVVLDRAIIVHRKRNAGDVRNIQRVLLVSNVVTVHSYHSKYTASDWVQSFYCNTSVQLNHRMEGLSRHCITYINEWNLTSDAVTK